MLDPRLQQRCEALARGEFTPPPVNSIQQSCGISAALAHLASLALPSGRAPPYAVEEENLFARLQLCYHQAANSPDAARTLYKLSPLVAPIASMALAKERPELDLAPAPATAVLAACTSVTAADASQVRADLAAAEEKARRAEAELLQILDRERRPRAATSSPKLAATRKGAAAFAQTGSPPPQQQKQKQKQNQQQKLQQQQKQQRWEAEEEATREEEAEKEESEEVSLEELSAARSTHMEASTTAPRNGVIPDSYLASIIHTCLRPHPAPGE